MSPFDPASRPLEPSTNGFIWCHECDSVQPVEGHVCFTATTYRELLVKTADRAEFAESVLCGLAFDHARDPDFIFNQQIGADCCGDVSDQRKTCALCEAAK